MAQGGILVFSLPLLVVLMGFLLSHAEGVDTAKTTSHPPLPIAVLGIIYCMSCRLPGYDKYIDASPLPGAVARLQCSSSAPGRVTVKGTTDKNGYFLIQTNKARGLGLAQSSRGTKSWVLANKHSTLPGLLHLLRPKEALVPVVPERSVIGP